MAPTRQVCILTRRVEKKLYPAFMGVLGSAEKGGRQRGVCVNKTELKKGKKMFTNF